MVHDAVVGGEHHAPAQRHGDGGQQIGQQQKGPERLLALFQTVHKGRHHETEEHLEDHGKEGELHRVPDGLAEVFISEELGVVFKPDEMGRVLQRLQQIIVCEAVVEGEDQRIGREDQQHDHRGGDHGHTEALGLCGAAEDPIFVLMHSGDLPSEEFRRGQGLAAGK